ncbi:hypothetical protein WP50_04690, partial [Lactiplantibacillus plantarum]
LTEALAVAEQLFAAINHIAVPVNDHQIQRRSGNKNVVIRLADLKPSSTTIERNEQIGGHRA